MEIRSRVTIDDVPYELFKELKSNTGGKVSIADDWVWLTIGDLICFLSKEDSNRYKKYILAGEEE